MSFKAGVLAKKRGRRSQRCKVMLGICRDAEIAVITTY